MRLQEGVNPKIDLINRFVAQIKSGSEEELNKGLDTLLTMFKPMILKICKKWSMYFNDDEHSLISWDSIITDAQYWFFHYTKYVYVINGEATYNNFIKTHIDFRVRYIYETELKYHKNNMRPDPDKYTGEDVENNYDNIVFKYRTQIIQPSVDDDMISNDHIEHVNKLLDITLRYVGDERYFTQKEKDIFERCMIHKQTHESIGGVYNVSRTRVSQIMSKIRKKLCDLIYEEVEYWEVFDEI